MISSFTRLTSAFTALIGVLAFGAAVAPAARAADSTTLLEGVTGVSDLAVGAGKVFVSANDRIVVTGRDGTRLYAALSGSNELVEIDTGTLAVTRRLDLAAYPCPATLSLSGDRLWIGYGCYATFGGG
ncbi:YncE family protein [Nonomuraea zeae]|nr:hypothetical protein [Nonomuraea zeae]